MAGISLSSSKISIVAVVVVLLVVCADVGESYSNIVRRPNPRSCGEAQLCCQGQNNTCFVFGQRVDRSEHKRCYCDSNCLIMGDCCMDYHHVCKSVDCEVGIWTEWTKCDNPCGYGSRKRLRDVKQYPDNGGHNCPVLKQRRACVGYEQEICSQNMVGEQEEEKAEQARILPIEFGHFRNLKQFSPWTGILKNLYKKHVNEIFTRATYTTKFRVLSTHHGCEGSDWANVLKVNTTVCVECQPVAMKRDIGMRCVGHGVYRTQTAWKAVDVKHCHGTWEMLEPHKPEVCGYDVDEGEKRNFIFL